MRNLANFTICCLIAGIVISCKMNQPPVIISVTANPTEILTGEKTQLTCIATDPENDQLTYSWSSQDGTFTEGQNESEASWNAPDEEGTYSIVVTVSDGENLADSIINVFVDLVFGSFTDSRDGKTYKTVKIGEQVWMAENLAYLPSVSPSSQSSATEPHYYVYGYNGTDINTAKLTDNYKTFGVLYNWPAAMQVCPRGWHLPSDLEWRQLENYLADNGYNFDGTIGGGRWKIAKSIASKTNWHSSSNIGAVGNNLSTNNRSGFSGLPAGRMQSINNTFSGIYTHTGWWSSTVSNSSGAFYPGLHYEHPDIYPNSISKTNGYSVRCVKD